MNFFTPGAFRDITHVTVADFSYTFAANENNIETMSIDHRPNQPYNTFSYDNLDRITDVVYLSNQNDVESFPMDDLGNRTGSVTQRNGVHNYSVNTLTNRYTTIDSVSISYDAAGNLIQDKDGYHYVYDYENRVIRIFKLDGQTEVTVALYAYDALGRRIWKYDPLATQPNVYYYYNDQWQILCEYTGTDSCLQWFTYGNYIDEVLSRNTSTTAMLVIQYYIQDHLYNVVGLANSGGTVVERYEYDVYGNPTISGRGADLAWYTADDVTLTASAHNNLFNFTGRQLDVLDGGVLKYMHYRHRDYSPMMGRFMQRDPMGYIDGINYYLYAINSPVCYYDPYGQTTSAVSQTQKKTMCELVAFAINNGAGSFTDPEISNLLNSIKSYGCSPNISCSGDCESGDMGSTSGQSITLCDNNMTDIKDTLIHELTHAYDNCTKVVFNNDECLNNICEEMRASSKSGKCKAPNNTFICLVEESLDSVADYGKRNCLDGCNSMEKAHETALQNPKWLMDNCSSGEAPLFSNN